MKPFAFTRPLARLIAASAALVMVAASAPATTVTYSTSYDGMPVADTLPDHTYAVARLYNTATSVPSVFEGELVGGTFTFEAATVDVPAGATRTIADVLGNAFGLDAAAGSLELTPRELQAWIRTSTPGGGGSYGQGYPMLAADDPRVLSSTGTSRVAAGGVVRGDARTNLVLAELWGIESTVRIRLLDRDGVAVGATDVTLRPFENA